MDNRSPDDSSRLLLDISDHSASVTEVREVEGHAKAARKKFIVTKHIRADSLNSPKTPVDKTQEFPKVDSNSTPPVSLNEDHFETAPGPQSTSSEKENMTANEAELVNREIDDVFDENGNLGLPACDMITNTRYSEGQDTITSLKNPILVKQWNEIRRKASLKNASGSATSSNSSINTNTSNTANNPGNNLDVQATPPTKSRLSNLFFKSQDSIASKKFKTDREQTRPLLCDNTDLNTSITTVNSKKPTGGGHRRSITRLKSTSESTTANNTDAIVETLAEAIKNNNDFENSQQLLNQIKYLLAQSDDLEKRKRRYLKRVFKLIACFFLLFTTLMAVIVVTSVFMQLSRIETTRLARRNITNHTGLLFSNTLSNNSTLVKLFDLLSPQGGKHHHS